MSTELSIIDATFLDVCGHNKNLSVQWDSTCKSIAKLEYLHDVWCRSRTPWALEHLTLTVAGPAPWKQMRQISAEVESKRNALQEVKYKLMRLQLEISRLKTKLSTCEDNELRQDLVLDISEKEEQINSILRKFNGAMQDIRDLEQLYDKLLPIVGEVTEDNVNIFEHESHLKRALVQSIRSVRQSGVIDAGNQEYLEQCSANPSVVLYLIQQYLQQERSMHICNTNELHKFVDHVTQLVLTKEAPNG